MVLAIGFKWIFGFTAWKKKFPCKCRHAGIPYVLIGKERKCVSEMEEDSSVLDLLTGIKSTQVAIPSIWANYSVHIRSSLCPLPGYFTHPPSADGSK